MPDKEVQNTWECVGVIFQRYCYWIVELLLIIHLSAFNGPCDL